MAKSTRRATRIGDQIQRELAELIRLEIKDPRIGLVTITGVEVSPDHSHAKVFFSRFGDAAELPAAVVALNHAAGFLHSALFTRLRLRVVPQLTFVHDQSIERGVRLTHLIDEAVAADSKAERGD